MHRLLQRQLKKQFPAGAPSELSAFLEDISNTYEDFEKDYKSLERTLGLSSQELYKTYQLLNIEKERIENQLKESYQKLGETQEKAHTAELIIKNSPTILVRWTPNFKLNIEYITENISHLGYSAKNWIEKYVSFTDFIHPDDIKPVVRKVLQCLKDKTPRLNALYRLRDAQGSYRWIESVNTIDWDENRESVKHFQGVLTDVTERVEAEKKLAESEIRFRSLVQNSTDITTILDEKGRTVYESPSFYRTFGYKEEEVIGRSIYEFIHPEDIEKAAYELTKGVERGGISDPIEFRIRHRNGSWLYVESVGNNLLNVPGIEGIVINSRDISDRKDAEARSEKLKEFYEEILDKIPADIVVFDNRHRYVFANATAITDEGKRAFIIGKDDYDYCEQYGKDISLAHERRAIFNKVAYTKTQMEFEEHFESNGVKDWMLRRMFPVLDEKGELKNVIGFGLDITKRRLAEEKLRESEQRLSLAIAAAKLGIWDWNLETGKLLWDKGMYTIFNIDPADFKEDYEAFEKTLHPDDKQRVFDSVQETIKGTKGNFTDTFRVISKSGDIEYVTAYSKLIRDEKGNAVRMIGVNFNVTESKLAEQKLLKSQAELEEAQHIARIGSWEIDMVQQKVTWSKELYNIYELDESFEPTFDNSLRYFTNDTRDAIVTSFQQAVLSMEPFDIEAAAITARGNRIDVRTKGIPVIEISGALHVKGITQDISKEKTAERQLKEYTQDLERINKELDQFAYIVSHDLKAPLRAINNLSTWIEEDLEGKLEGETQYQFKLLRGRVSRMEDLINGILDYSRAGRVKVNPSNVDVLNLINGLIEFLSPPPYFKINVSGDFPILHTEKILLEQVFSNLISNAIKYNKNAEPQISITCEPDGPFYRFGVADNGDGIEPEYHEKIFVIFQTLEARDKVESTGVGLAIVKKIVEEKGGQVWVESAKGQGSRFYFTWPK